MRTPKAPAMFGEPVRITARPAQGFYRAGLHHPAQPTIHPGGTFTEEQMEALLGERMLVVERADPESAKPAQAG